MNPITKRLNKTRILVLDGALATELERKGCDLSHPLWSAKLLLDKPEMIRDVHLSYLEAGADCIVSSGYQASVIGFMKVGLSVEKSQELYLDSIRLAVEARRVFDLRTKTTELDPALIAASIGPYGAYLADGSEYRGNYGIPEDELEHFQRVRIAMTGGQSERPIRWVIVSLIAHPPENTSARSAAG